MNVRKATLQDADGIAEIIKECYNISSLEEGKQVFLSEKDRLTYIIAEEDGKILGLTTWYMHGLPKHGLVELERIAVTEQARGKGAAKQLFDALVADAKEFYAKNNSRLRKVFLLTHASNERAHKFYEKLGMKHETTLTKHYYDNEDEWVYSIFI